MIEDFQVKAARYIMELGDWIEKLELLMLVDNLKENVKMYVDRLLSLQNLDGGFPHNWVRGFPSSIIETANAITITSKIGLNSDERIRRAIKFLIEKQLDNGSWVEENLECENGSNEIIVSAEALRALATAGIKGEPVNKGVKYLLECQRDDGLWPKSKVDPNPNLEATGKVIMALHEAKGKTATKAMKSGFEGLMEVFVEKLTKEWDAVSEDALPVIEAILSIQPKNTESVRKIIQAYVKSERWNFTDRRSEDTEKVLKVLKIMSLTDSISKAKVEEELKRLMNLKMKMKEIIVKVEDEAREILLSRFEDVGIRRDDDEKKILLGLFIYSLLEQFFWAVDYDPQREFVGLIDRIGRLDNVEKYVNYEDVKKALFRSKALSGVAKRKKEEAAKSISLYTKFLIENGEFESFEDYVNKLTKFTLLEMAPTLSGMTTAKKLGLLLRNYTKGENSAYKLFESMKLSLECFPSVGSKISTLYPYYVIWVYNVWSEMREYVEPPIDWNTVKPYVNLGLSNMTLKDLRKDPKKAYPAINRLAEELFPEDKAKISILWIAGREWCTKPHKCYGYMGRKCWFYDICGRGTKNEERGKEDMG
ncbi:MAG: terpene cyclase/mutase family protein [Candidatus Verstraetearchaeota archaeon]|nr:terpene cyclase/mutase family protein [Candidatus Verstraetearchaeota archaeon]